MQYHMLENSERCNRRHDQRHDQGHSQIQFEVYLPLAFQINCCGCYELLHADRPEGFAPRGSTFGISCFKCGKVNEVKMAPNAWQGSPDVDLVTRQSLKLVVSLAERSLVPALVLPSEMPEFVVKHSDPMSGACPMKYKVCKPLERPLYIPRAKELA